MRELATCIRKLEKAGSPKPYVAVDLRKYIASQLLARPCNYGAPFLCTSRFLPPFCSEHVAVRLPEAENRQPPKIKTELAIHTWLAAWDSYSLAAAMLGQMTYPAAMSHKLQVRCIIQRTVLSIACFCTAGLADRQPSKG